MDPSVTSPVPSKDAMGMDYVPVYSDEEPAAGGVAGRAPVEVSPDELRLAGLQTTVARRGTLARTIRTVGEVKADETRISQVHTRVSGWVERLFVNSSGQAVRKGQPLLSIYSPELLATQEEFLRARESADRFAASDVPEVRRGGADLLEAARRRLALFGVPAELHRDAGEDGTVAAHGHARGPGLGVRDGQGRLRGGSGSSRAWTLFTVTDLSRVWVEGEVYEYEAPLIRLGQRARVTLAYDPARVYAGRITYVYPYLNADSRTLRVRFELDNPGLRLKPGMYADVELDAQTAEGVLDPRRGHHRHRPPADRLREDRRGGASSRAS